MQRTSKGTHLLPWPGAFLQSSGVCEKPSMTRPVTTLQCGCCRCCYRWLLLLLDVTVSGLILSIAALLFSDLVILHRHQACHSTSSPISIFKRLLTFKCSVVKTDSSSFTQFEPCSCLSRSYVVTLRFVGSRVSSSWTLPRTTW